MLERQPPGSRLDRLDEPDARHLHEVVERLVAALVAAGELPGEREETLDEIVARYLKAMGDPREVVRDPEARYFGSRVEERSLVPLGDARLGRIGLDEWLRRSPARA